MISSTTQLLRRFVSPLAAAAMLTAGLLGGAPPAEAVLGPSSWSTICPGRAALAGTPMVAGAANCRVIRSGNLTRRFVAYVPSSAAVGDPLPLVFMFHGSSGSGEQFFNTSGWKEVAEAEGFVAVFPTGMRYRMLDTGRSITKWHGYNLPCDVYPRPATWLVAAEYPANDVGFSDDMLADIDASVNGGIDPSRLYVSGFSNGAQMTQRLAFERPDTFAAAGAWGGSSNECINPATGVPYAEIIAPHLQNPSATAIPMAQGLGTLDDRYLEPINRILTNLGQPTITEIPLDLTFLTNGIGALFFRQMVEGDGMMWGPLTPVAITDWAGTAWLPTWTPPQYVTGQWQTPQLGNTAGNSFSFFLLKGLGHRWPNAKPGVLSTIRGSKSVNAAALFWQFFERHSG